MLITLEAEIPVAIFAVHPFGTVIFVYGIFAEITVDFFV